MVAGQMYDPSDAALLQLRQRARTLTGQYNLTQPEQNSERTQLLTALFASAGESIQIEPNFHCDYGQNIRVGRAFYANFACVILDCAKVTIGDHCLMGPQVGIYTACHPLDPTLRRQGLEFAKPVTIGDNCWIGGHATINPGVELGNNVVVASGAVVTKSFASNLVIGGNPARILKQI